MKWKRENRWCLGKPLEIPGKLTSYWKWRESKHRKSFVHFHELVDFNTRNNEAYMSKIRVKILINNILQQNNTILTGCNNQQLKRSISKHTALSGVGWMKQWSLPHCHRRWNNSHFFVGFGKLLVLVNDTKYAQTFSHSYESKQPPFWRKWFSPKSKNKTIFLIKNCTFTNKRKNLYR